MKDLKPLTKESFLAGAKFEYRNKILGGNVTLVCKQMIDTLLFVKNTFANQEHTYIIIDTNEFGFFLDKWNNPDAILFVEYSDFVLCENED